LPAISLLFRAGGLEKTKFRLTQPSLVELGLGLSLAKIPEFNHKGLKRSFLARQSQQSKDSKQIYWHFTNIKKSIEIQLFPVALASTCGILQSCQNTNDG
jgi:hypothetical protein